MYVVRRVGLFVLSVVVASILVFTAMAVLPGNPAAVMLGTSATPESIAATEAKLGTDRPIPVQYADWFSAAVRGDLGQSFFTNQPIWPEVRRRLGITLPLAAMALTLSTLIAFPLGIWAAARHRRLADTVISTGSQIGLAVPAFWAGLMMVAFLVVNRTWIPGIALPAWFPASGFPGWDRSFSGSLRALILPSVSLALVQAAVLTRYVRSAVLETLREDYIRTARMKGLTELRALWRHGFRNASLPVLTVLGLQFGALLAGSVVLERVFVLPGLGSQIIDAIGRRDLPIVQGATLVIVVIILSVNLLIDLLYRFIDPRVTGR